MRVKMFGWFWAVCCTLVVVGTASAQQGTATVNGNSRSLYFSPMSHFEFGIGNVYTYLTTFDGMTDRFPTNQQTPQGTLFSGELRPVAGQPENYQADYATATPTAW